METCQFTYNKRDTLLPTTALGIEWPWEDLKQEWKYNGDGLPGASYYKTISKQGPELFAVVNEQLVYYYENEGWHRYITSRDIKYGTINLTDVTAKRAITDEEERNYHDMVTPDERADVD